MCNKVGGIYTVGVKANPRLKIPVIGNGDITNAEKLREAFDRYGVDGVMVGRASIGAPWIFRELKQQEPLSTEEKFDILRRQIRESIEGIDEYRGILHIRRHLAVCPLFKGIPNFRETRIAILQANTMDELFALIDRVQEGLNSGELTRLSI